MKIKQSSITALSILLFCGLCISGYSQIVKIGNQQWTAKNLNVSSFRNGETIAYAKTEDEWLKYAKLKTPAWCYVNFKATNGNKYGKLYNWYAVSDKRGLAPNGFHIPSDKEWIVLGEFLGGMPIAGEKMKSKESTGDNKLPEGSCGFDAMFAGMRYYGGFRDFGRSAEFWTSTDNFGDYAFPVKISSLSKELANIIQGAPSGYVKAAGLSVRCIKN